MSTISSGTHPSEETERRTPSKAVLSALRKYELDPTGLGLRAFNAWIELLTPLVGAATRPTDDAHLYAKDALGVMQELVDEVKNWPDAEAAAVFDALGERWKSMRKHEYDLAFVSVLRWLEAHTGTDRAKAVAACIRVTPPAEVEIEERLPMTGYQKRVFKATWTASGRPQQIVLKEFLGDAAKVIPREMQAYPLSMMHPNIIQTYRLENPADPERPFLAERRIHPLHQDWDAKGLTNAAQVLTDLARALAFLNDQGLVHGDIKPDNIGYDEGRYLLLDFGVARPVGEFAALSTPTGTLRTRAPEVILGKTPQTALSDVYALGASVFNIVYQQFPLIDSRDDIGDAHSSKRDEFVTDLRARLETGWEGNVSLLEGCRHHGFRDLLRSILNPDPSERPPADEVLRRALKTLPGLVGTPEGPLFRPWEELDQMELFLSPRNDDMRLLPQSKAIDIDDRLTVLERGLATEALEQLISELLEETKVIIGTLTDEEAKKDFTSTLEELERQKVRVSGGIYEQMIEQLRERLSHHNDPWPTIPPDAKRALEVPLRREFVGFGSMSYRARMRALREALERRQALPSW